MKRIFDVFVSLFALIILSPLFIILIFLNAIFIKGNPFFTQFRPGKNKKMFKLIKFRSMTNEKDKYGELLADEKRLTKYGIILRSTSLDELPELINILKGDMSLVGPRPLLVKYLPYFTENEQHRHDIRPGLTGLAQVNGRNFITWEQRFSYDLEYVNNLTFYNDIRIIAKTIKVMIFHTSIADRSKIYRKEDGKKYILINGEEQQYTLPLNEERIGMDLKLQNSHFVNGKIRK